MKTKFKFREGQYVVKTGGDYRFPGIVRKSWLNGRKSIRYIVEAIGDEDGNYEGMSHVFNEEQLEAM